MTLLRNPTAKRRQISISVSMRHSEGGRAMKRVLLGGILAGLALFAWGAVSHMALPLGEAGVLSMPADREGAVVEARKGAMSERALYFFPGMSRQPTPEEQKAWEERVARGPWGIVAYNPGGGAGMSPRP